MQVVIALTEPERDRLVPIKLRLGPGIKIIGDMTPTRPLICSPVLRSVITPVKGPFRPMFFPFIVYRTRFI